MTKNVIPGLSTFRRKVGPLVGSDLLDILGETERRIEVSLCLLSVPCKNLHESIQHQQRSALTDATWEGSRCETKEERFPVREYSNPMQKALVLKLCFVLQGCVERTGSVFDAFADETIP